MRPTDRLGLLRAAVLVSVSTIALGVAASPGHAQTASGPVKPYYGNIRPFYGNIRPFEGELDPYYGNIRPFYGNIRPFYGARSPFWGDVTSYWGSEQAFGDKPKLWWGSLGDMKTQAKHAPDYRSIPPYWSKAGAEWTSIMEAWRALDPAAAPASEYAAVAARVKGLVSEAETFWGRAVQGQSGRSFKDAFAQPMLSKWGIDPNDPASFRKLDATAQASFFLDWYDGLMNFAGTDHVDWWTRAANWSPSLTQTQGSGKRAVIGLLDFTVVGDKTLTKSIVAYDGVSTFSNGHGAAVASLMVAGHDRRGVMGIAPKASVSAYNPFDATGSASWNDVRDGILMLTQNGASIVNMSLGVPGATLDQGWNQVFSDPVLAGVAGKTVFVIAAGNEGLVQQSDLAWNFSSNPTLLLVGSVGLDGTISNFSNRPGTACLLEAGACAPGARLMDRFLVAPGELILVSDDKGGWTRQTGTSFAAPLVSGAVALLHDRWPWLAQHPKETADIILRSATDLGAPGVDPVYGHGLLNIQASQSPLDFNSLRWFTPANKKGTSYIEHTAAQVVTRYNQEQGLSFDAQGFYFYAFEPVGQTFRDFAIPMSDKLVGQTFTSASGYQAYFQAYLKSQLDAWATGQPGFADATNSSGEFQVGNPWGADLMLSMAPRTASFGFHDTGLEHQAALTARGERSRVTLGFGDGAVALSGQPGFGLASDYDGERGGVNPLLGLASGGAYANWSVELGERLQLSAGATQRKERRDAEETPLFDRPGNGAHAYRAGASRIGLDYRVSEALSLTGAFTRLREDAALLGVQSLDPADFRGGSTTDGVTLGFTWRLAPKFALSASGTRARTRAADEGRSIAVEKDGLTSAAYQLGFSGRDLFAKGDALRVTLAQPLGVEKGRLTVRAVEVVDRSTGELGVVSHTFDVGKAPGYTAQLLYGRTVGDAGQVSLFGQLETDPQSGPGELKSYMAGGRYRLQF